MCTDFVKEFIELIQFLIVSLSLQYLVCSRLPVIVLTILACHSLNSVRDCPPTSLILEDQA